MNERLYNLMDWADRGSHFWRPITRTVFYELGHG